MGDVWVNFALLVVGIVLVSDREEFDGLGYFLCLFCGNAALFAFVVRVMGVAQ